MPEITNFLAKTHSSTWHAEAETFFKNLIAARYGSKALNGVSLRVPMIAEDKGPFAAILKKDSPTSGGYSGTSFVVFPSEAGAFFSLGVGTHGLAPDEDILSRPGHARFCRAFANWFNRANGYLAWSKGDPTRIDLPMPPAAKELFNAWPAAIQRYGNVLYVTAKTGGTTENTEAAFFALLDFYMRERGFSVLTAHRDQSQRVQQKILEQVLLSPTFEEVASLLHERRFVILQGPPGTGKTDLATRLLASTFAGVGSSYQFHPSTSYEQFIGGLAPVEHNGHFGFRPSPGILMRAAEAAAQSGQPYLLVLDEVNRADLARVLGEALFLLEVHRGDAPLRDIKLPYKFESPFGETLKLPENLRILGTMNSADRSTAILDLAVRRRFAFLSMWPKRSTLLNGPQLALDAFDKLAEVFLSEATNSALEFLPGHSYFLARSEPEARARLQHDLRPLLMSYVSQGLVPSLNDALDSYVQWLDAL